MLKVIGSKSLFVVFSALISVSMAVCFTGCGEEKSEKKAAVSSVVSAEEKSEDGFRIISVTPGEEIPDGVKFPQIQIQFSQPVVSFDKLGKNVENVDFITIDPSLKGTFTWYGTSLLSFNCSEELLPQKIYCITVDGNLKSVSGEKISGNLFYTFHGEELKVISFLPGYEEVKKDNFVDTDNLSPELSRDIALFFNAPVNPDVIKNFIKIKNDKGVLYTFKLTQEKPEMVRIKLDQTPEIDCEISVQLDKGAVADEGCIPVSEDSTFKFNTLHKFAFTDYDAEPYWIDSKYTNPVILYFTNQLKNGSEDEAASYITTDLSGVKITKDNLYINGDRIIVHGLPVEYNSTYNIFINSGLKNFYGNELGEDYTVKVKVGEALSYVEYKTNYASFPMLESQFVPKLAFRFQNLQNKTSKEVSHYSIDQLTEADGKKIYGKSEEYYLDANEIPKNTKITKLVDLTPFLQKTSSGEYRGAVRFKGKLYYNHKYRRWNYETQDYENEEETSSREVNTIIQVTDLGLTVRYAYNKAAVLVTSLKTGAPVKNADVNIYSCIDYYNIKSLSETYVNYQNEKIIASGKTDADGLAVVDLPFAYKGTRIIVEAKTKDDRAIFNPDINSNWAQGVARTSSIDNPKIKVAESFMFTDRGIYKPGEKISFRIIDRNLYLGEYSIPKNAEYKLQFGDTAWKPVIYYETEGTTSSNGTVAGVYTIPEDMKPGTYNLIYSRVVDGKTYTQRCQVQVQFFERLRFEANTTIAEDTYISGDSLNAVVNAKYLGGGNMGDCYFTSSWSREECGFKPKSENFKNYRFGPVEGYDGRTSLESTDGNLDSDGNVVVTQKTGDEKIKGMAYSYRVETKVTDTGNQEIGTVGRVVVHPALYYIGISSPLNTKGFTKKNENVDFDFVCVKPDGTKVTKSDLPASDNIKIQLLHSTWKQVQQLSYNGQINTRYVRELVEEQTLDVKNTSLSSDDKIVKQKFTVTPKSNGAYIVRLTSCDSAGREVVTERYFYVTGSDWYFNGNNLSSITFVSDKDEYEAGDTAHLVMESPLPKGKYLVTVEREDIVDEKVITLNEPSTVLDFEVKENYIPVMYVTVSSYSVRHGAPQNDFDHPDLDKPHGVFGIGAIKVSPSAKTFDVQVTPDKKSYRPGEDAEFRIKATRNGKAVAGAEITLMAVDRGVIDLINYHVADPVKFFYNEYLFPLCGHGGDSRSMLLDPVTYEVKNLIGGDSADDSSKFEERKNFEPTAVFVPAIKTDENGEAVYKFKFPDSLTQYRITAVGVSENNFAIQESEVAVANPVSVRTVLPRELRLKDVGEAGVVISNIDESAHDVNVEINIYSGVDKCSIEQSEGDLSKTEGAASIGGERSQSIRVDGNKTLPVMFNIKAQQEGWITIEYIVTSDVLNEKIYMPLQIEKPYVYDTVTTVGKITDEESVEEKLVLPVSDDNEGSLSVELDATHLGMLKDAVSYVFHYPYGCLEQRSAAILPLITFGDYIKVLGLNSEVKHTSKVIEKELDYWSNYQKYDGSFPYWPEDKVRSATNNFVTARIAEICGYASSRNIDASYYINTELLKDYLVSDVRKKVNNTYDLTTCAYELYGASCISQGIGKELVDLVYSAASENYDAKVLCGLAYYNIGDNADAKKVVSEISKYMKKTTRGVEISVADKWWNCYGSAADKYSLSLQLITQVDKNNDLNERLIYELMQELKLSKGYWYNTQGTLRALVAFSEYIEANNLKELNLTGEVLLEGKSLLKDKFKGVGAEAAEKTIDFNESPLSELEKGKELSLQFNKEGKGNLYYTASMKHAVMPAEQSYVNNGIEVFTQIIDVKTGEVVTGSELVAGRTYREVVYISSNMKRNFVALRVPIPCGCEIQNAVFATQIVDDEEESDDYWWNGPTHQSIYDCEVQYFWDKFYTNTSVSFTFRAARKGTYNVPGASAECMYQEEIFGRTSGKVWNIE